MAPLLFDQIFEDIRCHPVTEQDILNGVEIMKEFIEPVIISLQQTPSTSGCPRFRHNRESGCPRFSHKNESNSSGCHRSWCKKESNKDSEASSHSDVDNKESSCPRFSHEKESNNESGCPRFSHEKESNTSGWKRSWRRRAFNKDSETTAEKDYKIRINVKQFQPEELKITVDDDFIIVEGKHEEREDEEGFISRQFTRKYKIPQDVDVTSLSSKLTEDGILTLQAPKMIKEEVKKVFEVPIHHANHTKQDTQEAQPQEDKETTSAN